MVAEKDELNDQQQKDAKKVKKNSSILPKFSRETVHKNYKKFLCF